MPATLTHPIRKLADAALSFARCSGCGLELPGSAIAEEYRTCASCWIVVQCPDCRNCTPFRLEPLP